MTTARLLCGACHAAVAGVAGSLIMIHSKLVDRVNDTSDDDAKLLAAGT